MNLDWAFYYDSWLIDKVPNGLNIEVTETENGLVCVPDSLTCYFGANPIYLYGEGKLFHESLVSPRGIAIYPEFLDRPGFEWVDRKTFKVDFPEELDFNGNVVVDLHAGHINATQFMKDVLLAMYGLDCDGVESARYTTRHTPSTSTHVLTSSEYEEIAEDVSQFAIFTDENELRALFTPNGVGLYVSMGETFTVSGETRVSIVTNLIDSCLKFSTSDQIQWRAGLQRKVFSTNGMSVVNHNVWHPALTFTDVGYCVLFRTLEYLREGTILSIGEENDYTNGGFSIEIHLNQVIVHAGDVSKSTDMTFYTFALNFNIDFRFPHTFAILFNKSTVDLVMDGDTIGSIPTVWDYGNFTILQQSTPVSFLIGASRLEDTVNSGDIEELLIAPLPLPDGFFEKYFNGIPILYDGGLKEVLNTNTPPQLSYDLTYTTPTDVFIPNYLGEDFDKHYLKNHYGHVIIAGYDGNDVYSSSYQEGLEPYEDKSLYIPLGYTIDNATMASTNVSVPETNIKVLTKLTSDVHIPLRIHMDFVVPENFYKKDISFPMRLVVASLTKWLWYPFKKFKTGEFI